MTAIIVICLSYPTTSLTYNCGADRWTRTGRDKCATDFWITDFSIL